MPRPKTSYNTLWSPLDEIPDDDLLRGTALDEAVRDSGLVLRGYDINPLRDREIVDRLRLVFSMSQTVDTERDTVPSSKKTKKLPLTEAEKKARQAEYMRAYYKRQKAKKRLGVKEGEKPASRFNSGRI